MCNPERHIYGQLSNRHTSAQHKESDTIRPKGGVRQGDTISPKLNWENVKIGGEFLTNLRFVDDIILMRRNTTRTTTGATRTIR